MTICILLFMLLVTIGTLLAAVLRKPAAVAQRLDYDIIVYRDQLGEIDKDIERGLLTAAQADAARQEIHRRMLTADKDDKAVPHVATSLRSKIVAAVVLVIFVPLGVASVYAYLGSPELPGAPYASRLNTPEFIEATETEKLADQLEKNPDVEGYKKLSLMYFKLGFEDKAVDAYQKAIAAMKPVEQHAMIQKMVDRLADHMKDNPDDIDGWQRLAKAYRALGQTDKAQEVEKKIDALNKR